MFPFRYSKAADEQSALRAGATGARYIAVGTTLVDLRSRRLLERWQVERHLKLPLLGEVGLQQ